MRQITGILACIAIAVLCAGCGSGSTPTRAATGSLTLRVIWPPKPTISNTRLIPVASNSILAVVTSGGQTVGSQLITGEDGTPSNPSTVTFNNLTPGSVTLTATAYPTKQGTGVAQATGSQSVTIVSNKTATATVTMASTIDHVTITPANPFVPSGNSLGVTLNAFDAAGNMVLVPLTADFESTNTAIFQVTVGGNPSSITAFDVGSATLTVKETESGKTASTTVTVTGS